jgi:hypothetical protein
MTSHSVGDHGRACIEAQRQSVFIPLPEATDVG